ncbi:MAG: RNA polymerase sigma-I factor [Bacillota bacterium]
MDHDLNTLLHQTMAGDSAAREKLIAMCRPFVSQTACALAGKKLEWGVDDELSIALIALNQAIEIYQPDKGAPFLAFARIVIRSRLNDYWRKENRYYQKIVPLVGTSEQNQVAASLEIQPAWDNYWDQEIARERGEEIQQFNQLLKKFKISFQDLVKSSPQHADYRKTLLRIAAFLVKNTLLLEFLLTKKKLPIKQLVEQMGVSAKTVERGRRYIIAVTLILYYADEFTYLRNYIQLASEGES